MRDIITILTQIRRPKLLSRAARLGQVNYCRAKHLPKDLGRIDGLPRGGLVMRLAALEDELDRARRAGDAAYTVERHVQVLIALLAEAQPLLADHAARKSKSPALKRAELVLV